MANKEKLRQVWEFIKAHRELLDMDYWVRPVDGEPENINYAALESHDYARCGTTGCLAGWTALLDGWTPVSGSDGLVKSPCGTHNKTTEYVAQRILELTDTEKIVLFYARDDQIDERIERALNAG
jgi:hypothetical protein